MGFSVSASAAIIFISFLMVAGTLYTAWDNTYTNVQAAQEYWYEMRLSRLHFDVSDISVTASGTSDIDVTFKYRGQTLTGGIAILHNGDYVSSVDLGYLIPGKSYTVTVTNGADTSGNTNYVLLGFDNGCTLLIEYYYDTGTSTYKVGPYYIQCPTEVS
ncbi:Putative archaeal flagellar protein F [Thermococcus nautili]|uniref:flagellar protein n=1 Tax=Thermococcus nautili TaxID=195522 RepID=UPI002552DB5E|nr:flagellar protein [Thermococcus nautili]CAI1493189.1 Putative archaeal flagellar protein F [Thermococcus nautili]